MTLGGTVEELQARMSVLEFRRWRQLYVQEPWDDYNRYHRPAALIAAAAGCGKIAEFLDWLAPGRSDGELSDADMNTMRAMGFTRKGG